MLVNDIVMEATDETYNLIDTMSDLEIVFVCYPDGALWSVLNRKWKKENNA